MGLAINAVGAFLLLYFIYYYALRLIQSLFQNSLSYINRFLSKLIYGISTPAHELAHLIVALVCFSQVEHVKLFPTGNEPGYVKTNVSSKIPFVIGIKKFFISIAPALINIPLFMFIECRYVLKCNLSDLYRIMLPSTIFSKSGLITLGLFIVLVSGIAPSHADLKGTLKGLITFCVLIFAITYFTGHVVVDFKSITSKIIGLDSFVSVVLYYIELIAFTLVINIVLYFKNGFKVVSNIFIQSIKHTFSMY
ncbi:hypothetical protein [Clostridium sp. SM-530-WT-3G]|uniref:hypothetical protein n=1 Tax=Clostridium sp. SM-530-WT-3G TaxID=2725303 RepID=UPI00145DB7C2|nr:hypothetical protein [Clostridium sp. SM-530-WT-3G]NME82499.1 hypothetical protein [Clostridium sp. SM-530-WT-3G]